MPDARCLMPDTWCLMSREPGIGTVYLLLVTGYWLLAAGS